MCGISGYLLSDPSAVVSPDDLSVVLRITDALAHRGPDAQGYGSYGPCVLGHRRLSILDLSPAAQQPLVNEDGSIAAVVNGEIYNFKSLRDDLIARGHTFRSRSDSETVVHLYEEHGADAIARLDGMFALALWDAPRKKLLLARDRSGKKPLYYRRTPHGLAFASEVQALVRAFPHSRSSVDLQALDAYLTLQYVPTPRTAFTDIRKLPAATLAMLSPGETPAPKPYWHRPSPVPVPRPFDDLVAELRALLTEAVRRRMVSDVPLGAFLSGGLDSSTIVALMAGLSPRPVETFSIGFRPDDPELSYARAVSQRYGTHHHEALVHPAMTDVVTHIVRAHGAPFADSSAVPMHYLSKLTRTHVTVALSGDAADEDFAGYKRYIPVRLGALHDRLSPLGARAFRTVLSSVAARVSQPLHRYAQHLADGEAVRYATLVGQFTPDEKRTLYGPRMSNVDLAFAVAHLDAALQPTRGMSPIARVLDLDYKTYLTDDINAKVDIASMASALEVRCPFLDTAVVEFAARLPMSAMLRLRGKYILRRMAVPLVPHGIIRRTKRGFALPLEQWLRTDLRALVRDVLLDGTARTRGIFHPPSVENLVTRLDHDPTLADRVWTLMILELWFREFVDSPPS